MAAKYTDDQIIEALRECRGMKYVAAKRLGCDPNVVRFRMRDVERVRLAAEQAKAETVDFAEMKLLEAIKKGEPWAITLYLKTQARDRGYGDRIEFGEGRLTLEIPYLSRRGELEVGVHARPALPASTSESAEADA